MLYQYFDASGRKLDEEIESLEKLTNKFMRPDDIIRLIELKAKRETLHIIFNDLFKFVVDFDEQHK